MSGDDRCQDGVVLPHPPKRTSAQATYDRFDGVLTLCPLRFLGVCLVAIAMGWSSLCPLANTYAQSQSPPPPDLLREDPDSTTHRTSERDGSRAEQWKRKRRAKRQEMQPPEPGFFEQVGHFFSRLSGSVAPRRLLLTAPKLDVADVNVLVDELAPPTGGLLYEPPPLNDDTRLASLEATAGLNGEYATEGLFGFESNRYVGYAYGRYRHNPEEVFYGIGPDSRRTGESAFRRDEGLFGGLLGRSLAPQMLLGGHVSYQFNRIGTDPRPQPRVQDHLGNSLPGATQNVDYLMVGSFFEYDSRDTPYERAFGHRFAPTENRLQNVSVEATRGFYLAAEATHNLDYRYNDFSFTRFTLDMREFIPIDEELLHGFALRQFASVTRASDGEMPFYRMPSLGGSRSLRGYTTDRFRDRNAILVNAEVRCEIWHRLDMALFTDAGHVFRNVDNLDVLEPQIGYGVGFRIKKNGQTLGRIDFARSTEGLQTTIDVGSLF